MTDSSIAGFLLFPAMLLAACAAGRSPTSTIQPSPTMVPPSRTPSASPQPTRTPVRIRTGVVFPTGTPSATPTFDNCLDTNLPKGSPLTPTPLATIQLSVARSYANLRVPPYPAGIQVELQYAYPYGEGYFSGPFYSSFLVNSGGAQMLWIGLPYADYRTHRITDAVPFPPLADGEILLPFTCMRDDVWDVYLIAVARCGHDYTFTEITRAWRIDPANETIGAVSTRGITCFAW